MNANEFHDWLEAMMASGKAKTLKECAEMIGRTDQWISLAKSKGTDLTVALACNAVLHGLGPFQTESKTARARPTSASATSLDQQ